jgi:hypothetical protein
MGVFDSIGNVISTALTNSSNAANVAATNKMNERLTRESWARDDTAYQRKAVDLEAAGLNPILAASGPGAGNSSPIKAESPRAEAPRIDTNLEGMVMEMMRMKDQFKTSEEERRLLQAQGNAYNADAEGKRLNNSIMSIYGALQAKANLEHTGVGSQHIREQTNDVIKAALLKQQTYAYNQKWQDKMAARGLKLQYAQGKSLQEQTYASQQRRNIEASDFDWYYSKGMPSGLPPSSDPWRMLNQVSDLIKNDPNGRGSYDPRPRERRKKR